jgi:putative ABC transport system permease protein
LSPTTPMNTEAAIAIRTMQGAKLEAVGAEIDARLRTSPAAEPIVVEDVGADARLRLGPLLEGLFLPALALAVVAAANVATLLLIVSATRQREYAVKAALGASPARLAVASLGETAAVVGVAATAGGVLAMGGVRLLASRIASINPILAESISGSGFDRALGIAAIALVSLPIAGLAPALFASRGERLLNGDRPIASPLGRGRYKAFDALLFAQVALGVGLMLVVAMFTSMVREIRMLAPRFPAGDVLIATMSRADSTLRAPDAVLRQAGGAGGIALASRLPAAVTEPNARPVRVASRTGERDCTIAIVRVTPNYFDVVGIGTGQAAAVGSAIATENAVQRCWADSPRDTWAVRQASGGPVWIPIAAVVSDGLGNPRGLAAPANVYIVDDRHWENGGTLMRRRTADGARAFDRIGMELAPSFTVSPVKTPQDLADEQARQAQLVVEMLALVAFVALVISVGGVYASLAHGVEIRRREIGVRLALGAGVYQILRAVTERELPLLSAAAAVALAATFAVTHMVFPELLWISGADARVWVGVSALAIVATCAAFVVPALRAFLVNPAEVLRRD